jgi:outer membrane biosynthesis protein TonB
MILISHRTRVFPSALAALTALFVALLPLSRTAARAQQPEPQGAPQIQQASPHPDSSSTQADAGGISEDELKQMLIGKTFYLRGGYLDDTLTFNEHGRLSGHSPQGSFTLSLVEIDRVHLEKHKVELEGVRYGLHFLGALPYEDSSKAFDKVRITPKKKVVRISIDREAVIKPKKTKPEKPSKATPNAKPATQQASATQVATAAEPSDADQLKAEIAATPTAERPADLKSVTTTTSPAHATAVLKDALDAVLAPSIDERMQAAMPDFWKFYYQAAAAKTDYRPADPSILRQNTVDKKAQLISTIEPESNQLAQDNGIAGASLYHTIIGPDGKASEIAVGRPIGFGLDENAVKAIQAAKFEPAVKDGKPVPVLVDLVVQFRIFSKRTATKPTTNVADSNEDNSKTSPKLPGPYSVHPDPQF